MKKPYSSTFIWQLGSKMYGSCRGEEIFFIKEGASSITRFYLTWEDIKQTTCSTHTQGLHEQANRRSSNSFSKMCLPKDAHTHKNTQSTHKYIQCVHTRCMQRRDLLLRQTKWDKCDCLEMSNANIIWLEYRAVHETSGTTLGEMRACACACRKQKCATVMQMVTYKTNPVPRHRSQKKIIENHLYML